ncbi:MAG TPA: apolipoprotein N-acyltransferase [Caldimonas sp.]|nr:apolipoprotein N-acyltransferase [Caldimonas sp.]HEV7578127.1 apolipoprotein N-acyltransferase [Caldimonas sp.]
MSEVDAVDAAGVGVGAFGWLRHPALELAVVAALGALQTIAFVDGDLWPLQMIAVALLAWAVGGASPRRAAALGFVFGVAWLCAGTWWLYVSMHRYGDLAGWLAALAVLALSAFLSLYLAAAMALVARWRPRSRWRAALLFAAAWLLAELARAVLLTGFPWVASGYAQVDSPLAGFASSLGVYGVGALAAGLAAGFGFSDLRQARGWLGPGIALALALVAGAVLGRIDYTTPTRALTISLLQGNVPQQEKFEPQYVEGGLAATAAQLAAARGELVVGPETVIPVLLGELDDAYWTTLVARFRVPGRAAILGVPMGDPEHGYTNSALGLSAATTSMPGGYYRYDKHHLVPFGEFVPTGFHWFTRMMNIPLGDFNRGPLTAPSFDVDGERVAPNICYEDLFGEDLAARFVPEATAPTILANLSNIGWFGRTIAIEQHLRISRMRSLELQRPMIRATNTGATAVIDHHGAVTHALPPFSVGILEGTVEGRQGLTPFASWAGRFGLWPLWALGVVLLLVSRRRGGA